MTDVHLGKWHYFEMGGNESCQNYIEPTQLTVDVNVQDDPLLLEEAVITAPKSNEAIEGNIETTASIDKLENDKQGATGLQRKLRASLTTHLPLC